MSEHLILRLDGMPGSHVKNIARDMINTSNRLGLIVGVDMNGTRLIAVPNRTKLEDIERSYELQIKGPRP